MRRFALCSPPHGLAWVGRVRFSCLNLDSLMNVARLPERLFNRIQLWSAGEDIHAGGLFFVSLSVLGLSTIYPGDSNMKWMVLACAALVAGCANSPPTDNRSFPGAGQSAVDERREARALELAESNCVSQGKDVDAGRVEGQTVYNCVQR